MAEHPNVELVRRGYEAFGKGDMETIGEIFADDIKWHIPGRNPIAGDRGSKEEVFAFFGQLMELTGGTFQIEIHDIVGGDDHVVALTLETASRDGRTLRVNGCHVWHVEDGKAVEFWGIPEDIYAEDEFYG